MIYDSILETIGRTPIVRLGHLAPPDTTIYAKCEFSSIPAARSGDRLAIAHHRGCGEPEAPLKPGQTVIEATSGNTGIALAMVCAAKGYPFVAVMVEPFSVERRKIMRMFGARVILTPAAERGQGMVRKAEELAKKHGWFLARQFENPANPAYHRSTYGPEILSGLRRQAAGLLRDRLGHRRHTHLGAGEMIRLARPDVHIVAAEPGGAQVRDAVGQAVQPARTRSRAGRPISYPRGIESQRAGPHRDGQRCRGDRRRASAGAQRGHLLRHLLRGHVCRRRQSGARSPAPAPWCWRCCPDTGERYLSTGLVRGDHRWHTDPEP